MAVFNLLRLPGRRLSLARKNFLSPPSSASLGKGSGATYYDEELKYLYHLLKNLPDVIPEGNAHDFTNYVPDPQKTKTSAAQKSPKHVSNSSKGSLSWIESERQRARRHGGVGAWSSW
ncbi:hypothetical protein B0H14DRAFT_2583483 [Mycena olivaceomarginata]|nr:hypothetical protein B0H14DRAFT_2583483 [Mycena olivaceomarginata]